MGFTATFHMCTHFHHSLSHYTLYALPTPTNPFLSPTVCVCVPVLVSFIRAVYRSMDTLPVTRPLKEMFFPFPSVVNRVYILGEGWDPISPNPNLVQRMTCSCQFKCTTAMSRLEVTISHFSPPPPLLSHLMPCLSFPGQRALRCACEAEGLG